MKKEKKKKKEEKMCAVLKPYLGLSAPHHTRKRKDCIKHWNQIFFISQCAYTVQKSATLPELSLYNGARNSTCCANED